jgi:hypothetical protein
MGSINTKFDAHQETNAKTNVSEYLHWGINCSLFIFFKKTSTLVISILC